MICVLISLAILSLVYVEVSFRLSMSKIELKYSIKRIINHFEILLDRIIYPKESVHKYIRDVALHNGCKYYDDILSELDNHMYLDNTSHYTFKKLLLSNRIDVEFLSKANMQYIHGVPEDSDNVTNGSISLKYVLHEDKIFPKKIKIYIIESNTFKGKLSTLVHELTHLFQYFRDGIIDYSNISYHERPNEIEAKEYSKRYKEILGLS
jgi:hypothetical protein